MVPHKITFTRLMLGVVAALVIGSAEAHDPDHHEQAEWYQSLMQPDIPNASCCGEADAYWADEIHVRNGKTYAKITDDRPDEPRHRLLEPRWLRLLLCPTWRSLKFGPVAGRGCGSKFLDAAYDESWDAGRHRAARAVDAFKRRLLLCQPKTAHAHGCGYG